MRPTTRPPPSSSSSAAVWAAGQPTTPGPGTARPGPRSTTPATPAARRSAPRARRPRFNGAMAFDPATGQLVLFGGQHDGERLRQRHLDLERLDLDPGRRHRRARLHDHLPSSPPAARAPTLAYDPATGQLVLFGGNLAGSSCQRHLDLERLDLVPDRRRRRRRLHVRLHRRAHPLRISGDPRLRPGQRPAGRSSAGPTGGTTTTTPGPGTATWSQVDDSGDVGCTTTCTPSPRARPGLARTSTRPSASSSSSPGRPPRPSTTPGPGTAAPGPRSTTPATSAAPPPAPPAPRPARGPRWPTTRPAPSSSSSAGASGPTPTPGCSARRRRPPPPGRR